MTTLVGTDHVRLHVAAGTPERDLDSAEAAARAFLTALGVRLDSPELAETPARMTRAYAELLTAREFDLTTFENDEGYRELVLVRDIPFRSLCEHHALPFVGTADVAYLPAQRIIGISKLARVVELFAHRPQVQERMTQQIANWLELQLRPAGVGVLVRAEHLCMTLRGVNASGTTTITSALHGVLLDDAAARHEFFVLTNQGRQ